MSDRRPSKELYVQRPVVGGVWDFQPADDSEVLAHVRRGVESGTIKGEVVEWCETHEQSTKSDSFCAQGAVYQRKFDCSVVSRTLLGPVDGGEDR